METKFRDRPFQLPKPQRHRKKPRFQGSGLAHERKKRKEKTRDESVGEQARKKRFKEEAGSSHWYRDGNGARDCTVLGEGSDGFPKRKKLQGRGSLVTEQFVVKNLIKSKSEG